MMLSDLFKKLYQNDATLQDLFPSGAARPHSPPAPRFNKLSSTELLSLFKLEHQRLGLKWNHELESSLESEPQFVITGQQAVFAGGPMLIWEKARTCIALAHTWRAQGLNVLPIFWIAGDDSDHAEVMHFEFAQSSAAPKPSFERQSMVGPWVITSEWQQSLIHWQKQCQFPIDLTQFYQVGQTWSAAFAQLIQSILGDQVLFMDGSSPIWSQYSQGILNELLKQEAAITELLNHREQQLKFLGLKVQVPHRGGARVFTVSDHLRQRPLPGESHPLLSHDALSRPLVIDHLLAVQAHILGPGELQYFAQLSGIYALLGIPFPQLGSRMHCTIDLDSNQNQALGCLNLDPLPHPSQAAQILFDDHFGPQTYPWQMVQLPGMSQAQIDRMQHRFEGQWKIEKSKWIRNFANQHPLWKSYLQAWRFMGSGRKQERILSPFEWSNQQKSSFLKLDPLCPTHQWSSHVQS